MAAVAGLYGLGDEGRYPRYNRQNTTTWVLFNKKQSCHLLTNITKIQNNILLLSMHTFITWLMVCFSNTTAKFLCCLFFMFYVLFLLLFNTLFKWYSSRLWFIIHVCKFYYYTILIHMMYRSINKSWSIIIDWNS